MTLPIKALSPSQAIVTLLDLLDKPPVKSPTAEDGIGRRVLEQVRYDNVLEHLVNPANQRSIQALPPVLRLHLCEQLGALKSHAMSSSTQALVTEALDALQRVPPFPEGVLGQELDALSSTPAHKRDAQQHALHGEIRNYLRGAWFKANQQASLQTLEQAARDATLSMDSDLIGLFLKHGGEAVRAALKTEVPLMLAATVEPQQATQAAATQKTTDAMADSILRGWLKGIDATAEQSMLWHTIGLECCSQAQTGSATWVELASQHAALHALDRFYTQVFTEAQAHQGRQAQKPCLSSQRQLHATLKTIASMAQLLAGQERHDTTRR